MRNLESQKLFDEKRNKYMNGEMTYTQFYTWLASFIGVTKNHLPVSQERINNSVDESLNDIPLQLWDNKDPIIRRMAYNKGLAWSLSDTVCVLKTVAKL